MIRTVVMLLLSSLYMVFEGGIFMPLGFLLRDSGIVYRSGIRVARLAVWLSGARISVENPQHLRPGRSCVYVCNHISNLDPPAVATILPRVVIMAKREAFKIPIAGRAFLMAGFIPVDRGTERAAAAVSLGAERLKQGFSILAFPEGNRGPDG